MYLLSSTKTTLIITLLVAFQFSFIIRIKAQQSPLMETTLVNNFYALQPQQLFWFATSKNMDRAKEWLTVIEHANPELIHDNANQTQQLIAALSGKRIIDSIYKATYDRDITKRILNFLHDQQNNSIVFNYDEITPNNDSLFTYKTLTTTFNQPVATLAAKLVFNDAEYLTLKKYLADSITINDTYKYNAIVRAINYRKYFATNNPSECIIVNIPEAMAYYYKNNVIQLKMRVVVGRSANPTKTIAAYVTSIVTFPYWNVPASIATKEILPKARANKNYIYDNNFEIIDRNGAVVNESEIQWGQYNAKYFPYRFRQATGADNALGMLKFNMNNPFSIYLHATNRQSVFLQDYRFLSHGCVRLEKPFELANALLGGNTNIDTIKNYKKNSKSKVISLPHNVASYIIYNPVFISENKVVFLNDIYNLINK